MQKSLLIDPAKSRIKVFEFEHGLLAITYTCTQCAEAWCMQACPVEPIAKNLAIGAMDFRTRFR